MMGDDQPVSVSRRAWQLKDLFNTGCSHSRTQTTRSNAGWLTVERLVQLVVGFVIGAMIARHLGVAGFGLLSFAIALTVLLSPFWSASQALVVRDLAARAAPEHVLLGSATAVHLVATLVAASTAALTLLLVPGIVPDGGLLPSLIVLSTVVIRPLTLVDYWFQAELQARRAVLARSMALLVLTALRVLALLWDAPLVVFASLAASETVLTAVALLWAYRSAGGRLSKFRIERRYALRLARESFPLLGSGLGVALYMRIDQAMLGTLSGPRETGIYSIAVTLSEVMFFLPVVLFTVLMPGMTHLFETDRDAYNAQLQAIFSGAIAISYVTIAIAVVAGPFLIPLVYGLEYSDVIPIFLLLILGLPFVSLGVVQSIWTAHARQQGLALLRIGVASLINIVLNLLLLPTYGALGAAVTTLIAYAVAGMLANAFLPPCWPVLRMQFASLRLRGVTNSLRTPSPIISGGVP